MPAANHKSSSSCKAAPDRGRTQAPGLQLRSALEGKMRTKVNIPDGNTPGFPTAGEGGRSHRGSRHSLASSTDLQAGFPAGPSPSLQPAPPRTVLTNGSKFRGSLPSSGTGSLHILTYVPLLLKQRWARHSPPAKGSRQRQGLAALLLGLNNKEHCLPPKASGVLFFLPG